MRVALLALGSRGDVLPYLALCEGLMAAGHEPAVATFENFAGEVRARGFAWFPIRGDIRALLRSSEGQQISQAGRNLVRFTRGALAVFRPLVEEITQTLNQLVDWAPDLLLNQLPGGLFGFTLVERTGAAQALVSVIPLVPSRTRPMLAFPSSLAVIPGYSLLSHRLAYQVVWRTFRPVINRWRRSLGLAPSPVWGYFEHTRSDLPVLNGFSPLVVPPPPDWGPQVHLTGYWFPEPGPWRPPPELQRFLAAGAPPVFIGFGSMPVPNQARTTTLLLEALRRSGHRAVLAASNGELEATSLPSRVHALQGFTPYGWLFPRMAAVVHHGGSGTTGFGLRAGVPSMIVPFTFDQFYWGRRLDELGVGPRPIPFRALTAERLASCLGWLTGDADVRERAQTLARRIQRERGVRRAVEILQELMPA